MAHSESGPGEPEVRKHLIEDWHSFYALYVRVALDDSAEFGQYTHDALHPKLVALQSGQAVEFKRMSLPDGHPLADMPRAGHPTDPLWIGEDDVIHVGHRPA